MRAFKLSFFLCFLFIFIPSDIAFGNENKSVIILNPKLESEFCKKLIEGISLNFSENNINIIPYMITDPNDKNEILRIKKLSDENNILSIISLNEESNKLIRNFSDSYLNNHKIIVFDIGKNDYKYPKNVSPFFLDFELNEKMDIIIKAHDVSTVNFLVSKAFTKSKFFSYIEDYMINNPNIKFNIIYSDIESKVVNKLKEENSLTVVFSNLYKSLSPEGIISELTPFGTMEKIALVTDNPVYGGFKEYGTRFNAGSFGYSGIYIGNAIANDVLYDAGIISDINLKSLPKNYDFFINTELNRKLKLDDKYSVETYNFKNNVRFFSDKKIKIFEHIVLLFIIIFIYLISKNIIFKKLYNSQIKLDSLKTNFIANISHELRTPLNIIISTVSLFEVYIKNGEIQFKTENSLEKFKYLKKNSFRLLKLINNIIDTTRMDAGYFTLDKKKYNIVEIVEDVTISSVAYAEKKNIELIFDTNYEEIYTFVDSDKIERVCLNLLSNALKFTPAGGRVTVFIDKLSDFALTISVKDTGCGISKENQKTIFDRFVQANNSSLNKNEGSGIGLSLCKSIIKQHGGSINIKSTVNVGTTFIIQLPILNNHDHFGIAKKNSRLDDLREIEFSDY